MSNYYDLIIEKQEYAHRVLQDQEIVQDYNYMHLLFQVKFINSNSKRNVIQRFPKRKKHKRKVFL